MTSLESSLTMLKSSLTTLIHGQVDDNMPNTDGSPEDSPGKNEQDLEEESSGRELVLHTEQVEVDSFLNEAFKCLTNLQEQLSVKDAPPTNEFYSSPRTVLSHNSSRKASFDRLPISPASIPASLNEIGGTASFETETSRGSQVAFFQNLAAGYKQSIKMEALPKALVLDDQLGRWKPLLQSKQVGPLSERKMGHSSLSALVRWTMDEIQEQQYSGTTSKRQDGTDKPVLVVETNLGGAGKTETLSASNKNSTPRRSWRTVLRRNNGKMNQPSPQVRSFPVVMSPRLSSPIEIRWQDEEKKEEPRFQLFGSEYARHLASQDPARQHVPLSPLKSRRCYNRKSSHTIAVRTVEDADPEIRSGAVLDICVTLGNQSPPKGYYRISQTASGLPFSLPKSTRNPKKTMYLNVKKEPLWDKAAQRPCVTALCLIYPDRQEFVPPGFCVVRHASTSEAANLSIDSDQPQKAGLERVYLCFRRSREGNPLTGIIPLMPQYGESIPLGYTVVERSPRNHVAHLSTTRSSASHGHGNSSISVADAPIFLAYRQRLANLESLRPLPLVLSVQEKQDESSSAPRLTSYYSTGGTVVDSHVGRFHILDRSTHSLLSPSSVNNRLSLIEESRRRHNEPMDGASDQDGGDYSIYSASNLYLRSDETSSIEGSLHSRRGTQKAASLSSSTVLGDETRDGREGLLSSLFAARDDDAARMIPMLGDDPDLIVCLEALNFIPSVEVAVRGETKAKALRRLPIRSALLVPILTACYTRHGGGALTAVESLVKLLTTTSFFQDDVDVSDDSDSESSTRLTLLDLAIQTVCDVSTTGSEETTFSTCVEFVEQAVRFARGQLNIRTIGYVFRFYLFVFYFGASIPTRSASRWPKPSWRPLSGALMPRDLDDHDDDFPILLDPREAQSGNLAYLPGGAPQAAALALKELISLSIMRLGKVSVSELIILKANSSSDSSLSDGTAALKDPYGSFLDSILNGLVDKAANLAERASCTQLALHQVLRSGGSELFWYDMANACGQGLFGKDSSLSEAGRDVFIMTFALLANTVKVASGKLRSTVRTKDLMPRDIGSKLLFLELLLHFLEFWSDEQEAVQGLGSQGKIESVETFGFIIRRTVAPCLLWNTRASIENPQVFRRVIGILSEMWCSSVHRCQCKVELGVLIDHFALRILGLGPELDLSLSSSETNRSLFLQQVDLIREIKNWFSNDPKDVIEFYLNFDTDTATLVSGPIQLLAGTQWKTFQRLCGALSDIAEKCGEEIGKQIRENQTKINTDDEKVKTEQSGWKKSNSAEENLKRESARLLRKTSLEAILQIVKSLAVSAAAASGPAFIDTILSWDDDEHSGRSSANRTFSSVMKNTDRGSERTENEQSPAASGAEDRGDGSVLGFWQNVINVGHQRRAEEPGPSAKESLDIALEIAGEKNVKKAIDYLIACNALTPAPRDIASFLRINRERLDPGDLGHYISEGGTGGPETEYFKLVRYLFVRAISFVGMDAEQALRHFLTTSGFRLPGESQRIDRVMDTFSRCFYEDNAGDPERCPFKSQDSVYLLAFAILMLNTDLHKARSRKQSKKMTKTDFITNLRGVQDGSDIDADYLSTIYDSIHDCPIAMDDHGEIQESEENREEKLRAMLDNVRTGDSLLRGLAVHDFRSVTIDDFEKSFNKYTLVDAISDLTFSCVAKIWHQWLGVINTGMETAHLDPQGMGPSIEILLYALAVTICLDMRTERSAFLSQLGRLRVFEERRQGIWISAPAMSYRDEPWFEQIESACSGSAERKLWALNKIRELIQSLELAMSVDLMNKVEMNQTVAELKNCDYLLNDPARSFSRSGGLIKRSSRTGRSTKYRFYLFSDVLLYASKDGDGLFKVHEELPLHLMKIVDWFPPQQRNRLRLFQVHHPRKSFQVVCSSEQERKSWVEDIRGAIKLEIERKMKMEAARLSLYSRLQL